jgi:hypothetical protein
MNNQTLSLKIKKKYFETDEVSEKACGRPRSEFSRAMCFLSAWAISSAYLAKTLEIGPMRAQKDRERMQTNQSCDFILHEPPRFKTTHPRNRVLSS